MTMAVNHAAVPLLVFCKYLNICLRFEPLKPRWFRNFDSCDRPPVLEKSVTYACPSVRYGISRMKFSKYG